MCDFVVSCSVTRSRRQGATVRDHRRTTSPVARSPSSAQVKDEWPRLAAKFGPLFRTHSARADADTSIIQRRLELDRLKRDVRIRPANRSRFTLGSWDVWRERLDGRTASGNINSSSSSSSSLTGVADLWPLRGDPVRGDTPGESCRANRSRRPRAKSVDGSHSLTDLASSERNGNLIGSLGAESDVSNRSNAEVNGPGGVRPGDGPGVEGKGIEQLMDELVTSCCDTFLDSHVQGYANLCQTHADDDAITTSPEVKAKDVDGNESVFQAHDPVFVDVNENGKRPKSGYDQNTSDDFLLSSSSDVTQGVRWDDVKPRLGSIGEDVRSSVSDLGSSKELLLDSSVSENGFVDFSKHSWHKLDSDDSDLGSSKDDLSSSSSCNDTMVESLLVDCNALGGRAVNSESDCCSNPMGRPTADLSVDEIVEKDRMEITGQLTQSGYNVGLTDISHRIEMIESVSYVRDDALELSNDELERLNDSLGNVVVGLDNEIQSEGCEYQRGMLDQVLGGREGNISPLAIGQCHDSSRPPSPLSASSVGDAVIKPTSELIDNAVNIHPSLCFMGKSSSLESSSENEGVICSNSDTDMDTSLQSNDVDTCSNDMDSPKDFRTQELSNCLDNRIAPDGLLPRDKSSNSCNFREDTNHIPSVDVISEESSEDPDAEMKSPDLNLKCTWSSDVMDTMSTLLDSPIFYRELPKAPSPNRNCFVYQDGDPLSEGTITPTSSTSSSRESLPPRESRRGRKSQSQLSCLRSVTSALRRLPSPSKYLGSHRSLYDLQRAESTYFATCPASPEVGKRDATLPHLITFTSISDLGPSSCLYSQPPSPAPSFPPAPPCSPETSPWAFRPAPSWSPLVRRQPKEATAAPSPLLSSTSSLSLSSPSSFSMSLPFRSKRRSRSLSLDSRLTTSTLPRPSRKATRYEEYGEQDFVDSMRITRSSYVISGSSLSMLHEFDAKKVERSKQSNNTAASKVKEEKKAQQFGLSLTEIRENTGRIIPRPVEDTIDYLKSCNGDETEGLFRRCARVSTMREVQERYDDGETVDFHQYCDAHLAAAILKKFLRELSEPLMTFELFEPITRLHYLEQSKQAGEVKRILKDELPEENYIILKHIFQFLKQVISKSDINLMTAANMATVFGPNIAWPKGQANLANVEQAVKFSLILLESFDDVFLW